MSLEINLLVGHMKVDDTMPSADTNGKTIADGKTQMDGMSITADKFDINGTPPLKIVAGGGVESVGVEPNSIGSIPEGKITNLTIRNSGGILKWPTSKDGAHMSIEIKVLIGHEVTKLSIPIAREGQAHTDGAS